MSAETKKEERKIEGMRIASQERLDKMSLPNLKRYRKKIIKCRKRLEKSCDRDFDWVEEINYCIEKSDQDIRSVDWLHAEVRRQIEKRKKEQ